MTNTCTLYGIPNCDQVKKARDWLAGHELPYEFHDFKKHGVSADLVSGWLDEVGLDTLLNRKGTTWRGLPPERKVAVTDAASAIPLLLEFPSLIKRPVLNVGGRTHVGFADARYQQIFQS